jgi:hypothetical protein
MEKIEGNRKGKMMPFTAKTGRGNKTQINVSMVDR